jgi:hypothetical protein
MSLSWNRRSIARAVLGELSPAAEQRLARHLLYCRACAAHHHLLCEAARALGGRSGPTRVERTRALARLEHALASTPEARVDEGARVTLSRGARPVRWSLPLAGAGALSLAVLAALVLGLRPRPPAPRDPPRILTVYEPSPTVLPPPPARPERAEVREPFDGDPPGYAKQEVLARFDFEGPAERFASWNAGTIRACPTSSSGVGRRCIVGVRTLPCCPWSVNVNWGAKTRIFQYSDDLMVTFRYRTGLATPDEPVAMQLQVMDDRDQHYSFPFTARGRGAWHRVTIPLAWLHSYPDIMVGIAIPKRGVSAPLAPGTNVRSLQIMLRYAREDVLLVDDVELVRYTRP